MAASIQKSPLKRSPLKGRPSLGSLQKSSSEIEQVFERLHQQAENRSKKLSKAKRTRYETELKDCTFKPNMQAKGHETPKGPCEGERERFFEKLARSSKAL